MITATYAISGVLLAATGWMFHAGHLDATIQTAMWSVVFFFASAAASAAYLTVGECFPLEIRALTIALFYAFGTLFGGVGGPWLFGVLIAGGSSGEILWGYMLGAVLMIAAALVTLKLGAPWLMATRPSSRSCPHAASRSTSCSAARACSSSSSARRACAWSRRAEARDGRDGRSFSSEQLGGGVRVCHAHHALVR